MSLITKNDCMGATDLNHTVRHIYHVVGIFLVKCLMFFMTIVFSTCLINWSWKLTLVVSVCKITET